MRKGKRSVPRESSRPNHLSGTPWTQSAHIIGSKAGKVSPGFLSKEHVRGRGRMGEHTFCLEDGKCVESM